MVHSEQTQYPSLANSLFIQPIVRAKLKSLCHMICLWSQQARASVVFTRRSVKTISWALSMISDIAASIGRPERGASHVDVRPRLNSFTQLYTVANAGTDML